LRCYCLRCVLQTHAEYLVDIRVVTQTLAARGMIYALVLTEDFGAKLK